MAKQLLLVGDSNVRRYFDRLRGIVGSEVDFVQSRNAQEWLNAIPKCQSGYKIVTFSFLTNLIIDSAKDGTTDDDRLDLISPILRDIFLAMRTLSEEKDQTNFFLAPPNVRATPKWYSKLQPRITRLIYKNLKETQPRIIPLPAYLMDCGGLDSDGVHLNAVTGYEYVIHLIDKSRLLTGAQEAEDEDRYRVILGELASVSEAAGQLQFRVRALEDQRMVDRCEMLEEKDGRINSEALNHVVIKGKNVPFIDQSDDLQQKLKAQALLYLAPLNLDITADHLAFVRQFRGRSTVVYDLEFHSKEVSKAVRAKYGTFWRKRNRPAMPSVLKGISISNSLTFATRVRVSLMKEIAKRHTESNPGLQCFVTNYLPRPTLKLKDKGPMKTYGYVQAIKHFGHHFTHEFLTAQSKFAKTNIPIDDLLPTFLVLSPDLLTSTNVLNLSIVSNTENGAVEEMEATEGQSGEQSGGPSTDQSTSTGSTVMSKKTPGKGEKRKVSGQQKSSKKAATSFFG